MTFDEAHKYLMATYGPGKKKGLDAMKQALALLGDPQKELKIIHVAGTNGKGSLCAMLGSVLVSAGYRAGCFTSPHLQTIHERFAINNRMITDDDFARHLAGIAGVSRQLFGPDDTFSYFEVLTLMAFTYFCEQDVDVLLLEVGIGGRLDATNVIDAPVLSVIMSIGMDHMEILGDNIQDIAREKAGIIKENCPVVLYDDQQVVYTVMEDIAATKNSKIYRAADVAVDVLEASAKSTKFLTTGEYFGGICIELNLMGQYQLENARCAIAAAAALNDAGFNIGAEDLKEGLAGVKWPGRMEIVAENPMVILEGAHNLQGAVAAARNMHSLFGGKDITLVMGILNDKEYTEIVKTLAGPAAKVVFTKPIYDFRAVQPTELARALGKTDKEVHVIENCKVAMAKAIEITGADGVVFCSGSLYLVGDIRDLYKGGLLI